jgi:hypothetical protein
MAEADMSAKGDKVLSWLLEEENPSVRYFALRWLEGAEDEDRRTRAARKGIMARGLVPEILEHQNPDGSWGEPDEFYTDKYGGTVWQLLILAEVGVDGRDHRVRTACEFVLAASQDRASGGFSVQRSARLGGGRPGLVVPCLTGNVVWALTRLGMGADERVKAGLAWIATHQRFDDGDRFNRGAPVTAASPYDRLVTCFGKHSCHMGAAKALKALAAAPAAERSGAMRDAIGRGIEYFLLHRIHMRSHDPGTTARPGWLRFGFPLMYQTDVLELLLLMAELGVRDPRLDPALDEVRRRMGADGTWTMASSFNGKMLVDVEEKGKPSKWITLRARKVLDFYDSGKP